MRIDSWDVLEEISKDQTLIETKYKDNAMLKVILAENFIKANKWALPEGEPPFKPSPEPETMHPTNLYMEARRLYIFRRPDLTAMKRETLFIQMLSSVDPREVKILMAIKEQKLSKLYPKITRKLAAKLIPLPDESKSDVTQSV